MSFLPPSRSPLPSDQALEGASSPGLDTIDQRAMLNQNDEGVSEVPRKRGLADRVRSIILRRDLSKPALEAGLAEQQAWERERQHRLENEQVRSTDPS
jgi:hypothetical protein